MKPDMSKSNAMSDISSPSFLTPTTLKNITQILESEECMKSIQTFEETGDADKAIAATEVEKQSAATKSTVSSTLRTRSGNTYFNLDSKSWQGGITTVGTPTELVGSITGKFKSEAINYQEDEDQSSDEEDNSSENGNTLPEPVVQTNIRQQKKQYQVQPVGRTMITRSLSNMSNSSGKNSTKTYYSAENKRVAIARKTSIKGRRVSKYNQEDESLSPEERERLRTRRQRNKEAAARCRKRRVDQTNTLQDEVDRWIAKKRAMEEEIGILTREKDELEYILTQHCHTAVDGLCVIGGVRRQRMVVPAQIVVRRTSTATNPIQQQIRQTQQMRVFQQPQQIRVHQTHNPAIVAIKSEPTVIVEPVNQPYILPEQVQVPTMVKVESNPGSVISITKSTPNNNMAQPLRRPASLGLAKVTMVPQQHNNKLSEHGISIDTPSSIVPSLNFDTFTSTGLTPTATPVSGFSFPITSASTPTLNTPMTNTATISGRCSTQQRSSEVGTGSVSDINSPEGISLVSL
jgi:fos-like antigen